MSGSVRTCALGALALLLSGCRVGPERPTAPPLEVPAQFVAAVASGAPSGAAWWRSFGDAALDELVERALAGNHDLAAARARLAEARALAGFADAAGLPAIDGAADRQWLYASREAAGLAGAGVRAGLVARDQDVYRVGLDASWEVDLFGAVARRAEAADARAEATLAELDAANLLVAGEVVRTYVAIRLTARRLDVAAARAALLQRDVELAERRVRAGLDDASVAHAARAAYGAERELPTRFAAEVRSLRFRLAVLLGEAPEGFAEPAARGELVVPAAIGLGVPAALLRRRPDLRLAEADVAAATADVGVATADLYPRLFLLGGAGLESQSLDRLLRQGALQAAAGPSLQLPLFRGGALRQALAAAEARQRQAIASFAQRVLAALAAVESAAAQHAARCADLEAARASDLDAAAVAAATTRRREAGLASPRQQIAAELQRLDAAERLVDAELAAALEAVQVHVELGGGF